MTSLSGTLKQKKKIVRFYRFKWLKIFFIFYELKKEKGFPRVLIWVTSRKILCAKMQDMLSILKYLKNDFEKKKETQDFCQIFSDVFQGLKPILGLSDG